MQGNFVKMAFQAKFLQKATKSQEFCRNLFALLLYNTVELAPRNSKVVLALVFTFIVKSEGRYL